METKKDIRKEIYQKRRKLKESTWAESCQIIADTVISHPWFLEGQNIYTYVAYNREVETRKLIETAFQMGKNVWVPKVMGKVMHFFRIENLGELRPGAHGIPEPAGDAFMDGENFGQDSDTDRKETCGLMIMPGVAFDEKCGRIGYGGGYYDRYLANHPKLRRMALAFEFQIFPEVPREEYDICPELVITEKRMIESGRGAK